MDRAKSSVLDKLKDPNVRKWYAAAAVEAGWSRDVLAPQIQSGLRSRSGKAVTMFLLELGRGFAYKQLEAELAAADWDEPA